MDSHIRGELIFKQGTGHFSRENIIFLTNGAEGQVTSALPHTTVQSGSGLPITKLEPRVEQRQDHRIPYPSQLLFMNKEKNGIL